MKYGYFDDKNREYVIERPDTPTPWVNYLGSPEYGAIISNNAGGYSFAKSGANGRILRYIFNQFDQPGRYIYIRDNATKDYWSASWQPVGKDLDSYKSQCCHGMGYSRFIADYSQIHSEAIYYVPLGKTHEVWAITVTNTSDVARELTLTGYAEFTNHSNYEQDQVNLQYKEFLDEIIPFANKDEGSVYEHLKRAIQFSFDHLGPHGMPAGLYADWNDCLRLGANGESSFVAFQFYYAMTILKKFAEYKQDKEYLIWLDEKQKEFEEKIQELYWDTDRFIRGFTEAGERIGCPNDPEANMWLNPQTWSVISGLATKEQADMALENVAKKLNTEYGAILMDPPYHAHAFDGALAVIYNQGAKENSGIFSQSQGWLILAEALLGHGERAFQYFCENSPAAQNEHAEIRQLEPYCYGQFTEGRSSVNFGRSHVHWLTGTASTIMVGCVEGILGLRPDLDGIKIAPAIPKTWDCFEMEKDFRGKHLHIKIENPNHQESGYTECILNGKKLDSNYIPESLLQQNNDITLVI